MAPERSRVFPRIDTLDWLAGRPEAAPHDLGRTALVGDRGDEEGVVPAAVTERPDPPAGVNLHSLLGEAYGVHPKRVVVTAGASHAAFLAAATAVTESEAETPRVLAEKPGYEPHHRTPVGVGAAVDRFSRPAGAEWRLDADRVASAAREGTALVTVTNRHNPSGRLADRETLADAASAAREAGARLLVDEVYAPYGPTERTGAFGGPTAATLDGAVVVNSVSKFHGLPGLRVGWLVADEAFAERARALKRHIPAVADVTERLAARAVHADAGDDKRSLAQDHADLLAAFVADHDRLSGPVAAGCPYAFLSLDGASGDEVANAAWDAGVLVVPGRFFGERSRFRAALGRAPGDAAAGLTALSEVIADL